MKYILISILSIFFIHTTNGQSTIVKGKIADSDSGKVIPFAQVAFYEAGSQSPITGGTSKANGEFKISIDPGNYKMLVSFVGYQDYEREVSIPEEGLILGEINLTVEEEVMEEVVVEANEVRNLY